MGSSGRRLPDALLEGERSVVEISPGELLLLHGILVLEPPRIPSSLFRHEMQ
jgi:hypothetical protein